MEESIDKKKPCFKLIVPSSPQIPTPGREFLLKTPIEGISYIAATLKGAGYDVEIVDYRTQNKPAEEVLSGGNVVLGIATFVDSLCFLEDFLRKVRDRDKEVPIILGGPFVSSAPEALMRCLPADYAVLGEGESTVLELMKTLKHPEPGHFSRIQGICYRQNGNLVFNPPRPQIDNLDDLPLFDLYLWPTVRNDPHLEKAGFSSTRGCYSRCSFCFKAIPGVRQMSPERFGRQVMSIVEKHGLKFAFINDLTFVISRKRTIEMCRKLKESGIAWACSTRVENIDAGLLKVMRESGCSEIWYGFESVDQGVLDANLKGITVEKIEQAVRLTNASGIKVMANFIIGLLGETQESLNKMVDFIEKRDVVPCSIKYLAPFPGTYVYEYARKRGLIKDDIAYLRSLSKRKVNDAGDEIINCTDLPEEKLRDAFRRIREISYDRYGPLDWHLG